MTERTMQDVPEPFVFTPNPDDTGHSVVFLPIGGGKTALLNVVRLAFMRNPSMPSASETSTVE